MIVYYDETTKRIISAISADTPNVEPPKNEGVPLYLDDAEYANVRNDLGNYIIENDVPVYSAVPPSEPLPAPTTMESLQKESEQLRQQLAQQSADFQGFTDFFFANNPNLV